MILIKCFIILSFSSFFTTLSHYVQNDPKDLLLSLISDQLDAISNSRRDILAINSTLTNVNQIIIEELLILNQTINNIINTNIFYGIIL